MSEIGCGARQIGASELFRIDDESGEVVAQLSVGRAQFWLADESPQHFNFSPDSLGGGFVRMLMIVEDPDAAFERPVAAGANVVSPVGNQHGWRVGRVVDPFGHHWEIGKPVSHDRCAISSVPFTVAIVALEEY